MSISDIAQKLPLGSHHRMERFAFVMTSLLVVIGLCVTVSFVKNVENNKVTLGTQALYTTKATTSLTNQQIEVLGVYSNADRTKVFVACRFDDVSTMPTDASDYRMYLSYKQVSGNKMVMDYSTSGSWYVFGSTGVMGALFVNENGFTEQVLDLTVRADKTLSDTSSSSSSSSNAQTRPSDSEYDQFDILFNPAASEVETIDSLGDDTISSSKLYYDVIGADDEATIKKKLRSDLYTMQTALDLMTEYETRLNKQGIVAGERPDGIKGDSVQGSDDTETIKADGDSTEVKLPVSYKTTFQTLPNGAYDIENWQTTTVLDGDYLKNLLKADDMPATTSYVNYVKAKEAAASTSSSGGSTSSLKWYYQDGTEFKQGKDQVSASIQSDITNLTSAYSQYTSLKSTYFTTDMGSLLELETVVSQLDQVTTRNTSDTALSIYG